MKLLCKAPPSVCTNWQFQKRVLALPNSAREQKDTPAVNRSKDGGNDLCRSVQCKRNSCVLPTTCACDSHFGRNTSYNVLKFSWFSLVSPKMVKILFLIWPLEVSFTTFQLLFHLPIFRAAWYKSETLSVLLNHKYKKWIQWISFHCHSLDQWAVSFVWSSSGVHKSWACRRPADYIIYGAT